VLGLATVREVACGRSLEGRAGRAQ
jgi:hypothetical protein